MIGPFIGIDSPVTVVQMLWINVIMDTLGGLAFAGEPPRARYMKEAPKRRDEAILNGYMIYTLLFHGGFTLALGIAFLKNPLIISNFRNGAKSLCHLTAFFAFFIFSSVLNCFCARIDRLNLFSDIVKNKVFLLIMTLICAIQIIFIYLGGSVLRTVPLNTSELLCTLGISLFVIPADFLRKLLWRALGNKNGY
jgi:magnesium-transporting ATPase (P-type)